MVSNFTLTNLATEETLRFGQEVGVDFLFQDGGIDWGSAPASHNTYTYPGQIGVSISSTNIREREITISGFAFYVVSNPEREGMTYEEYVKYGYEKILKKKDILNKIINPEDYVRITVGEYYIDGKPDSSVRFGDTEETNNQFFCKFFISIYCENPMFKKKTIMQTMLSGNIPKFHFPLVFTKEKGIIFGIRKKYQLIEVENEGSIKIGAIITFKSKGVVANPAIENLQNGQKIVINKTLQEGEEVVINTNDGPEKGIKGFVDGQELNYFKYWDFENNWMKFNPGTSLLGYSVQSENESLLEVYVELNPVKFGVEEM